MDSKEKIIEIMLKENDTNNILKELTDNNLLNEFDFSNDCCKKNYIEEKDTLYKYIKYKVSNLSGTTEEEYKRTIVLEKNLEECNENKIPDADSKSKVLQLIYNKLYKEFLEDEDFKRIVTNKNNNIYGDTMNSVSTTLNKAIKRILEASEEKELNKIKSSIYYGIVDGSIEDIREELNSFKRPGWDCSIRYTTELYLNYDKRLKPTGKSNFSMENYLKRIDAMKLIEVYHTLGNFIIIPKGSNGERGLIKGLNDYWDLTLACIYNYYQHENNGDDIIKNKNGEEYSLENTFFNIDNKCKNLNKRIDFYNEHKKLYLDNFEGYNELEANLSNILQNNENILLKDIRSQINIPKGCEISEKLLISEYLKCVDNYYKDKKDEEYSLENKIFNIESKDKSLKEQIKLCNNYKLYLKTFVSWDKFVEHNFLESFVEIEKDENGKKSYGKPKELWKGHFKGELLPKNIDQCIDYFKNSSEWIKLRTTAMVEALNNIDEIK